MNPRDTLARYLDGRADAGRPLELWWRDDDLEAPSDALTACLDALAPLGIAPAFATIPAGLEAAAIEALAGADALVFPHGWAHTNHADAQEKKSEFGSGRPIAARLADIARGWQRVRAVAGKRAVGCFVPPWNRIGSDLLDRLGQTDLVALSAFAAPGRAPEPATLPRLDTHVDLIDWRGTGQAIPPAQWVERIYQHDGVDAPLGILSHHRVTGREAWADWRPILALLSEHPASRWLNPRDALSRVGVDLAERRTD